MFSVTCVSWSRQLASGMPMKQVVVIFSPFSWLAFDIASPGKKATGQQLEMWLGGIF